MGAANETRLVIGVLSDTHGPLSPEAERALEGVDHIVHAGDIGSSEVLPALRRIAPTTAVEGNMDFQEVTGALARTELLEIGGVLLLVLHDLNQLDLIPERAGIRAVISGHTHRPEIFWQDQVLYLNPGSAGPPRGLRVPTLARLTLAAGQIRARIVPLL